MQWDAIVVGAGPAGCAAAYDLAAAGRKVLLVDKASFPRAKACAGALTMKAVRALRYPVTPVVRKVIRDAMLEPASAPGQQLRVARRKPFCYMTVRSEFDAYCLDQTRARGVIFRQVGAVTGVSEEPGRVLLHLQGEITPLASRYLIGADGVHSRIRALTAASSEKPLWFRTGFALEANVPYSATGRPFPLVFDFGAVRGGYGWLFPRNDHVNVGLYTAHGADRSLDRAALVRYIEARCGTAEHDRAIGQFLGLGGAGYTPARTRVLLVGDAAGLVDPLTGEGISNAIASGQAAAAAIGTALAGRAEAAEAYREGLRPHTGDLAVSEAAARAFYAQPERGFRLMRVSLVRRAVLHAYSDGTRLRTLARGLRAVRGVLGA